MDDPSAGPVVIVGGGLTGMSAALHLRQPYLLLERESTLGGLCRTEERDGFLFDVTGHWLHLRDPYTRELVVGATGDLLVSVQRRAQIYSSGSFIRYPFQANVHGLPPAVTYECLLGYVRALLERGDAEPRNFEQYILHHFGQGIARHFMIPYNAKLWGVHPREITSAWCSRFVPIPTLEQMLAGAVGAEVGEIGYNTRFLYPRHGGIAQVSRALAGRIAPERVRLRSTVEAVDPARRAVLVGGEWLTYQALITTMPLPDLVARITDAPAEVLAAASRLRATSLTYLNVACRSRTPGDYHWLYVPEERLPFYRVGVYSNAMASMAPPGCASLYVELAGRGAASDEAAIRETLRALVEVRALSSVEDVAFVDRRQVTCAYVVFDESYEEAVGTIFPYLESHCILSCGRYGGWIYNSMEDSLLAGREMAARVDAMCVPVVSGA
jgi:protoporphyrinogen oxidase